MLYKAQGYVKKPTHLHSINSVPKEIKFSYYIIWLKIDAQMPIQIKTDAVGLY